MSSARRPSDDVGGPCYFLALTISPPLRFGSALCPVVEEALGRLTTSGSALANQDKGLSSRLLMLLMLKVATLTKSLSVPAPLGRPPIMTVGKTIRTRNSESTKCGVARRAISGNRNPHAFQH